MNNTLAKHSTGHNSETETSGQTEGLRIMGDGLAGNGTDGHDEAVTLPASSCQNLLLVTPWPGARTGQRPVVAYLLSLWYGREPYDVPSHPEREELISTSLEPCFSDHLRSTPPPPPSSSPKKAFFGNFLGGGL